LLFIVGILIFVSDKGPVFYNANRIGRYGKPFKMFKFRTMVVNAPDIRLSDGSTYNSEDDPRVTKIGRFLRNTSIDELPQIINVLIGDMSFIGNRADPLDWLDKYLEDDRIIIKLRPGITGYNQAYFRNSATSAEKLRNDVYYAKNISFVLDVKIFFRTIKTILYRENLHVDKSRIDK
jgi:lipopolysaccharide/colanic/teichoic acid biosynthesis glycosyltransferase